MRHHAESVDMRRWGRFQPVAASAGVLLTVAVPIAINGAAPEDGKAVFERREDTMKRMGAALSRHRSCREGHCRLRPGYGHCGGNRRALASTLDKTLFPSGSDVAESKIKPEIFARWTTSIS